MEGGSRDLTLSGADSTSGENDTKDKDITIGHEAEKEEQSDREGAISAPLTNPRGGPRRVEGIKKRPADTFLTTSTLTIYQDKKGGELREK
jgi:hypothetical protein